MKLGGIRICAFDAYGTLFDVDSAARNAQDTLGESWQRLAELWRAKQLQYTWLRTISGHHKDFWHVTGDALDFAMSSLKLGDPVLRNRLMNLYLGLSAYPEVSETLSRLKSAGLKTAILSNGTPAMLAQAAANAGISAQLDAILSVEDVNIYKPHHSVYQLLCRHFSAPADQVCFVSSNGWDAYCAKAFGFRVLWCNRQRQEPERIPDTPDAQISALNEMLEIVLG